MRVAWMITVWFVSFAAFSGGSPLRTAVVVNRNSAPSLELGRYYAEKRGIPDHHIIPIATFVSNNISLVSYSNDIEGPVRAYINDNGLSNRIDHVVFSMDIPYRVYQPPFSDNRFAGLTPTFYYGFHSSPNAFVSGCDLAAGSENPYFEREQAFRRDASYSSNRLFLAAMLTASNLPVAKRLVDRSVAADQSHPQAGVVLMRTTDPRRNGQWVEYEKVLFLNRFMHVTQVWEWLDADVIAGRTNVFGVSTGVRSVTWIPLNTALPGAFAQHLTSFGGHLFDQIAGQMSILDWIQGGYSGSHGTVVEPCAYTNKFASPRIHYWYARGFSLGESFWMSVQNPYQGIFVGDPLCAPYVLPPQATWVALTNGTVVSGSMVVTGRAVAASAERPVSRVDWYRNDRWQGVLASSGPHPGNIVQVTVDGTTRSHTVAPGSTLADVVSGMAAKINAMPPLPYTARAYGDRLEIVQKTPGASSWSVSGVVLPGTAAAVNVQLTIPETNFLESTFAARELITLSGNAVSGDVVRTIITRLDGVAVTNDTMVAGGADDNFATMLNVIGAINSNTALQDVEGCLATYAIPVFSGIKTNSEAWLFARTNTWEGSGLSVDFSVARMPGSTLGLTDEFSDSFDDNIDNLKARATVYFAAGVTQLMPSLAIDTTSLPDGPHTFTLAVSDGTGVEAEGRSRVDVVVDNHDLACAITHPPDRLFRLTSGVLTVQVATAASVGSVTQVVVSAEGKTVSTGLTAAVTLSGYGAGPLRLQAQAWDDLGRSTRSVPVTVVLYTDADADGMADQWEYAHFGAFTNVTGGLDADGDAVPNADEYIADTQPTNAASFLRVSGVDEVPSIGFQTSSDRVYRVLGSGDVLTPAATWPVVSNWFRGLGGVTSVVDASSTGIMVYAVQPGLPE